MLPFNFLYQFQYCEKHKLNPIHPQCIAREAGLNELNQSYLHNGNRYKCNVFCNLGELAL